jgi:hypothetical protein
VAQNLVHLAIVAGFAGLFLTWFGLAGAVLVTLLATTLVKTLAVVRISRLMQVPLSDVLPWKGLVTAALCALAAAVPAALIARNVSAPPFVSLALAGLTYGLTYATLSFTAWRRRWRTPLLEPSIS